MMIYTLLVCVVCLSYLAMSVSCQKFLIVDVAAFYGVGNTDAKGSGSLITKKPSSSLSMESLVLLDEISLRATVLCASISNVLSMQSQQKSFPMVDWWILEQGGRIFSRQLDSSGNHIVAEDLSYLAHTKAIVYDKDWAALSAFEGELRAEGGAFEVDSTGYDSMFIVRERWIGLEIPRMSHCADANVDDKSLSSIDNGGDSDGNNENRSEAPICTSTAGVDAHTLTLKALEGRIPPSLTYTYNNNALIIQVRGLGKLAGIEWLTKKLANDGGYPAFLYMGDDDNDVDAASKASHAYLSPPKGKKMLSFVQNNGSNSHGKLTTTEQAGPEGSAQLLHRVLEGLLV